MGFKPAINPTIGQTWFRNVFESAPTIGPKTFSVWYVFKNRSAHKRNTKFGIDMIEFEFTIIFQTTLQTPGETPKWERNFLMFVLFGAGALKDFVEICIPFWKNREGSILHVFIPNIISFFYKVKIEKKIMNVVRWILNIGRSISETWYICFLPAVLVLK